MDWLEPWDPIDDARTQAALERQLGIEVGPGHILEGLAVRLIARLDGTDDALFALPDGRVAEVHMTWRSSAETDPHWPATALFTSLDHWAEARMRPLHAERARRSDTASWREG